MLPHTSPAECCRSRNIQAEPDKEAVHVRYGSPSLNAEIYGHMFTFKPRRGVEERRIDEYPREESAS